MSELNAKVSQHGKQLSSLGQDFKTLKKQLNIVTNDVMAHGKRFGDLETRITATDLRLILQ